MGSIETVDPTIRNRRYSRWRPVMARVLLAELWLGVGAVLFTSAIRPYTLLALVAVSVILACYSAIFILILPWANPIARIKLGDDMEANPGSWHYLPERIKEIAFAPDPAEDYHDYATLPVPTCEVRIRHRRRGTFRLIVSEKDAERLRQWAVAKGIAVCDCDGYRPRSPVPAAGA
jgi:hypothetical protein